MTYVPLTKINQAIGSPEADNLRTPSQFAADIIYDKTTLVNILHSFGIAASLADDLITLINKVAPISINYVELVSDTFPDVTSTFAGNTDTVVANLFTNVSPSPQPNETFADISASFSGDADSGNVYLGGDALNITRSKVFVVINVIDSVTMQIDSTSGMFFGDTLNQGANSTTIVNITDSTHLIVGSTTGWVANTLVSTF
jgi:hypothetical protein